jgi:hypothetical protein
VAATEDHNSAKAIAEAVNEISDRASLLVREEIELAKAEVSQKVSRLAKGAGVGAAAGIFLIFAVILIFHGIAWLIWWLWFPKDEFFWGFFVEAAVLIILGGLAGLFAAKLFKAGSPPMPQMAIDEAKRTKEELTS